MVHAVLAAALAVSPASASLLECERGPHPAAEFEARMSMVSGATQLSMRFTLQALMPERRRWRRVAAPGFDAWTIAEPGTTRYVFTRRVEALIGPAQYRARVRFRWLDADGEVVARSVRFSRPCRVPDPRPNLTIRTLAVAPAAQPGQDRYVVTVRNTGRGAAGPFALEVGGFASASVDGIAAGDERTVELVGPACAPGAPVTAVVDPGDAVEERSEVDNAFTRTCP